MKIAAWQLANPARTKAAKAKWLAAHPAARAVYRSRRRARMLAVISTLTLTEWAKIKAHAIACAYCGCTFSSKVKPTMDHVIPLALGGSHTKENVVAACGLCNSKKGVKSASMFKSWFQQGKAQ